MDVTYEQIVEALKEHDPKELELCYLLALSRNQEKRINELQTRVEFLEISTEPQRETSE